MSNKRQEIADYLAGSGTRFSIIEHAPVFTMNDVEKHVDIPNVARVKTMVVLIKTGGFALCGIGANARLDVKAVARMHNKPRDKIALAGPEEIERTTGVPIGAIGLILPGERHSVFLSRRFLSQSHVYCGVGRNDRTLKIATPDLVRVVKAEVGDIEKNSNADV